MKELATKFSINVLNKPFPQCLKGENWFELSLDDLLTDNSRGIIPVGIERRSTREELNAFYNLEDSELAAEIARRVHQTVLFALDLSNMEWSEDDQYMLFGETPMIRGELRLNTAIPANAITHVFIPKGLEETVKGIFSHCEVRFIESTEMEIELPIPQEVNISASLQKKDPMAKYGRTVTASVPNYRQAITELAKKQFGDVANLNDKRKPLILHVTRLS